MNITLTRTLVLLCAVSLPAWGLAQGTLLLKNEAFQEIVTKDAAGKKQTRRVPAGRVVPGTEVIYVITYRNTSTQPADKVVISNPVPRELAYQGGSASGKGAKFEVSVDGGQQFGVLPGLKVPGPDGKRRPAQAGDVTHLRWTLASAVAAGAEGSVSYKAVLK